MTAPPQTSGEVFDRIRVLVTEEAARGGDQFQRLLHARAHDSRDFADQLVHGTRTKSTAMTIALLDQLLLKLYRLQQQALLDNTAFLASIATVEHFLPWQEGWSA
jgi:hypothetical protein